MNRIPIFIITKDRLSVLKESILSYEKNISTPYEIVIHDNNSTYEPMVEYLKDLEKDGIKIYRYKENNLEIIDRTINAWYKNNDSKYYVVTDPDISLDCNGKTDILDFYSYMLNKYKCTVVGPMLLIDDIPDYYPLKNKVLEKHEKRFWGGKFKNIRWNGKNVKFLRTKIDTTFGVYEKSFDFKRLNKGIRTCHPYVARHLDWYIDESNMTEDQKYYLENASKLAHWGSSYLKERNNLEK